MILLLILYKSGSHSYIFEDKRVTSPPFSSFLVFFFSFYVHIYIIYICTLFREDSKEEDLRINTKKEEKGGCDAHFPPFLSLQIGKIPTFSELVYIKLLNFFSTSSSLRIGIGEINVNVSNFVIIVNIVNVFIRSL